uniref:Acyl_transf_3 domain-containing protein n=1 Tax=Caenorhabditis tropicalis TaxID=1561998 RepID=A0A1I7UI26_9PELO
MDVFTHTWSLSVEVQFYVIVPFMFFIGYHFFTRFQIPYYFGLGMTAFLYTKSQNSSENTYQKLENGEKEDSMPEGTNETNKNPLLILIFLLASFVPIEIPSEILRPGITVMTGILMVSHRKSILESRILTYFGDISYSLYLIHWPIYAFWKSNYSQNDTWNTHLFIALAVSILLAMISYHFYEKFMKLGAPINVPDINEDPIYQEMRNRIDKLSEFVKYRIFIMHQVTRMIPAKVPEIVEAVKEKRI